MRHFIVQVQEGIYSQQFGISVDADTIEQLGDDAIESVAKKEWRRRFGPSLPMAYFNVSILSECI